MLVAIAIDDKGRNLGFAEEKKVIVSLRGVKRAHGSGETAVQIIKGAGLDVREGGLLVFLGEPAKLNIIGGMDEPTEGILLFDGVDYAQANDRTPTMHCPGGRVREASLADGISLKGKSGKFEIFPLDGVTEWRRAFLACHFVAIVPRSGIRGTSATLWPPLTVPEVPRRGRCGTPGTLSPPRPSQKFHTRETVELPRHSDGKNRPGSSPFQHRERGRYRRGEEWGRGVQSNGCASRAAHAIRPS